MRCIVISSLLVCLLVGCGKETASTDTVAVFAAPAKTVIAQVGDVAITVGDYRQRLAFETSVYRLTMMNAKHKPKDTEKRLAEFERSRLRGVLPQLVHLVLLDHYLDSACGGPTVENEEKILAQATKRLGAKIGRKGGSLQEIAGDIGVEPNTLRKYLLIPAQEAKARRCFDPAHTNVTEKEVDEGLARLDAYTARAVASNRTTRATCEKTLARIKAGADFVEVARTCGSEDPKEAVEWGWFNRQDFEMMAKNCPAFKRWAFTAKVGDVGGPFDIDDGLSIVKIVGRQDGAEVESMASKQVEEVQLVRINFAMVEEQPEPRTREHCREVLLEAKTRATQARLFGRLFDAVKIEYPNGDRLDYRRNEK